MRRYTLRAMLFETRAGPLRLKYGESALTAIEMPEYSPRELRAALLKEPPAAEHPKFVREAARMLKLHLGGKPQDLSRLPLALSELAPFQRAVYETLRGLPRGKTLSYGEVARLLGKPGASRAVGQALGKNPFLVAVPCHRVLGANGAPGGFSAPGGVVAKQRLLALEGVALKVDHGLPYDPVEAVRALGAADRKLGKLMERVGPFRLRPSKLESPFEALAGSIVYQQLNGRAAATILGRVVALYAPRKFPRPQDVLKTDDKDLRAAGLSGSKTAALKDLAAKTLEGVVPASASALASLSDAEIIERLTAVRGIGPWTVEMMLLFRLARPDVLPITDYGVRKGFALLRGLPDLPSPKELLAYGERWRPYRSVASWYLWRILDL